ncbi:MAG: hypothetical protein GY697_18270 [Desulfobacterales bacterium]|nr:hypothetical protein [Desulfobacterales bacterium]
MLPGYGTACTNLTALWWSGHIETYTVKFSRDGRPETAVIYGKTEAGFRFVAQAIPDVDVLDLLTSENQVGRSVRLRYNDHSRVNIADIR